MDYALMVIELATIQENPAVAREDALQNIQFLQGLSRWFSSHPKKRMRSGINSNLGPFSYLFRDMVIFRFTFSTHSIQPHSCSASKSKL